MAIAEGNLRNANSDVRMLKKIKTIYIMKFEKYVKPDLEELELVLEGSFLAGSSPVEPEDPDEPGIGTGGEEGGGDWD